jgi:hypothetical protein
MIIGISSGICAFVFLCQYLDSKCDAGVISP